MTGTEIRSPFPLGAGELLARTPAGAYGALDFLNPGRAKNEDGTLYYGVPGFVPGASQATRVIAANTRYYMPFLVMGGPIVISQLAFEITTAIAASQVMVGLFTADEDWQPTAILDESGTISGASNGVKTFAVNRTFQPGVGLLALHADSGITVRAVRGGLWGQGAASALGANAIVLNYRRALAYSGAFSLAKWNTTGDSTTGWEQLAFMRISDASG